MSGMRLPTIGTLTERVQVFRRHHEAEAEGGLATVFTPLGFAWARVRTLAARQGQAMDGRTVTVTHAVTMRFRGDLRPGDRIVHRGRKLEIIEAQDVNGRRAFLACTCAAAEVTG